MNFNLLGKSKVIYEGSIYIGDNVCIPIPIL